MLGVFKRRWRPKSSAAKNNNGIHTKNSHLVTNYNLYSEPVLSIDGQFEKIIAPSNRQIHSLCEEKAQLAVAYETIKSLPPSNSPTAPLPPSAATLYAINVPASPTVSDNESPTLSVNRTPNICVEDGRIEFVRDTVDGVHANNNNNNINERESIRHSRDEKIDNAKECMETRIAELEKSLETERKLVQREKLTVARLQRQLSRRELIQRDVDRERRLRLDSEAKLRRSESDTERCRAKLAVLQREFIRMEDTVRSMLQYKTKYEQLKQDKASLTIACENHIQHFQNIICKVKEENEELKKQLQSLNASEANSEVQSVLLERIEILQNQNSKLMKESESQRKQYEKCLEDVANQVVKALLTQKNLQEDVNRLQQRVKELESSNNSLSSLLLQRMHRSSNQSHSNSSNSSTFHSNNSGGTRCCQTFACLQSSLCNKLDVFTKKTDQQRPRSLDERRLQKIWDKSNSNSFVWVPLQRPQSLNLETSLFTSNDKIKKEREEESPESGNRDEGYSTMSSDVQGTSEIPHKTLEELKEVTDESDSVPFRLSLDSKMIRSRNSFPPVRHLLPYQHIMRSFSDSQLCLRITTGSCTLSPFKSSGNKCHHQPLPLLRTKFSSLLEVALKEENTEDGFSFCSSDLLDSEYIQQWILLDDKRSAMQHLQMEYNTAEVEDWSMEDTENWKKITRFNDGGKCAVQNLWEFSNGGDSDYNKNTWNEEENQNSLSSNSSWSSSATNTEESCASPFENLSKRSSSVLSSENGESAQVGTDFTRDFYRLVKFESSKSLASSSSKSHTGVEQKYQNDVLPREENTIDREQALQSVLKFIAEQQRYCISRLVQDENCCTVAGEAMAFDSFENENNCLLSEMTTEENSENVTFEETAEDETDDGYFSKLSFDTVNITNTETATANTYNRADEAGETCCDNEQLCNNDFNTLFKTCDTCFQNIEDTDNVRGDNLCAKCAECYIECLPEETQLDDDRCEQPSSDKISRFNPPVPIIQKSSLDTVLEEQEDGIGITSSGEIASASSDSVIIMSEQRLVSFHERATSKEVIDELNRMIRKGDEFSEHDRTTPITELDESFGCATGWVHVEQDIDFSDPKARANLLDVMLASSSSSSCDSSRNNSDSENCEDDRNYKHLHRLHRFRRQKRASATRQQNMGALRFSNAGIRPSIIGRDNFYNRYGEKEREAVASFDFLEELSTTSLSTASEPSDNASCPMPSYSYRSKNGYKYRNRYDRERKVNCDRCFNACSCSE